jgi:cell division protein FtsB
MKTKFVFMAFSFFGFCLIFSFSRDLWTLFQKEKEIEKSQLKLEQLKLENEELQAQLEYVQSQAFIESQAREKLGMAREEETVLMLPENLGRFEGLGKVKEEEENLPNWQKWWKLFF